MLLTYAAAKKRTLDMDAIFEVTQRLGTVGFLPDDASSFLSLLQASSLFSFFLSLDCCNLNFKLLRLLIFLFFASSLLIPFSVTDLFCMISNCSLRLDQLRKLKKYAARLIPLKKDHHLLLVTLLLVNAGVNEALPIFLDRVVPYPWMAVLLSVTMVLIFGEILPSAIFTGPNQLKIASSFSGVVCVFMWVLRPIAWPIARLLDLCLGHGGGGEGPGSGGRYERAKLKALLRHHRELGESMEAHRKTDVAVNFLGIAKDQLEIMQGALDLRTTTCGQACVPLDQVYMLSMEDVLDEGTLADILAQGYSRIPVYENSKHNVCGLLLVKKLIVINSTDKRTVRSLQDGNDFDKSWAEYKTGFGDLNTAFWTSNDRVSKWTQDKEYALRIDLCTFQIYHYLLLVLVYKN